MNINLYQLILEQLLIFLEPITLAVNSDRNQDRLFAEIAWDINLIDDFPRTKLNEKLSKFVQEYQTLESTINDPPKSFSEWLKDLENAENALNTLQELKNELGELGNRIPQLQELDQDLIGFLIIRYLQNWRPQWYQLALLCNVINFDTTTLEPVADGNSIVRFPQRHPLIELEEVIPKITALLTNPVPTLKTIYFGASQRMENEAEANAAADKLFPILGAFLQTLGAEVIYGWKAKEYGLDIGIAGEKLGRKMLTFAFVPDEGNNYFGATLSLSPKVIVNPEDNANVNSDLGLIVRPFGSFTPSEDEAGLSKVTFLWFAKDSKTGFKNTNSAAIIGIWEVEVQLTSGIEGFAIGPESATWLPANLSSVKGNIRLTKLLPSHEFAFILGSPIGSRLEIKSFQSFANINISQDTSLINYEVGINLENVALIFPEFLEIDIQQLEITLAKTQSRFKFKSFALSIPALFNQDIKGDLQLLFENGQLQLGSNQSYFKRFEPDEDNAVTLPLDGIYFDQNCLILRWQERRINFWLKSLIPNFFDEDSQTNNNDVTIRFLFGKSLKNLLKEIRLDWQITERRNLTLPGISVILPQESLWSLVIFFDNKNSIDKTWLIVTLPKAKQEEEKTKIEVLSNFSWKRDQERELQSNGNTQGENKPLFQLTLKTQKDVSLALMNFEINQLKLPKFFAGQLTNPLQKFDLENPVNSELLCQPTDNRIISNVFQAEDWELNFDFNLDQFTFPFLQKSGDFPQAISLGNPIVKNKDLAEKVIELDIPITIKIGTLELKSNITVKFNLETFALDIQHQEGIKIFINQDQLTKEQNYLGLEWTFISETELTSDPIHFFTLITQNFNYQLIQAPNTIIQLKYTSISKEPIIFEVRNFALTENGISLTAEITNQPVSLNGLETKFTFRNSRFEIKDNKIRDFTLKGSGPLPPALVGEAQADIALQFAQQNGSLTLVAGSAQLKASKTLYCEGIRFRFDIDALGLQFVNDGKFHLYFTLTGRAQFVPLASDDKDGPLALLSIIKIDLVQCPLTSDARVISKSVKFLIELPSKKSFNVLGCFEMELRAIGFKPQAEEFGGDGAIELTGQVKFAQGTGDTPNERADYHTLLIGLPRDGESIPRVYFKTLPVNLNVGEAFKLNGIVEFSKTDQEEGFSGEGSLEIQGLPPIAASFSFLRVRQNEQSPWLRAWFIYLEIRQVSFQIPIVQIYLREVGLGFGYRYTIASIKAADKAQDLRQLIQSLRTLSRTQGDLSKRDRWSVDLEDPGQDPRWTIALRALFSQTSASTSPLEYDSTKEENLPCVYLFDAVVAFRSDLTFFMAVRGWINTNYDYYYKNRNIEPLFSGFALLAPRQKRFLAQLSSNPNGFTGNNPRLPSFIEKAIKNSQFSATILIEPGLIHYELGWPNMLRWSDSFGPLKAEIRGGFIFRVSKQELVIGSSILARASLKVGVEVDLKFVGIRVSAEISVAYGTRYIGVVDLNSPTGNSALYAGVGLDARIRLSIEFWWLSLSIKIKRKGWRIRISVSLEKKTEKLDVNINFTAALELGINGLTPDQAGIRGSGTLSFAAGGRSWQISVKFSANGDRVQEALNRTEKYLQLGLEATDIEPVPGLPANSASRSLSSQPFAARSVTLLENDADIENTVNTLENNINIINQIDDSNVNEINNILLEEQLRDNEIVEEAIPPFKVPGYITLIIRQEKVCYFLLLPQGEADIEGKPEGGFLPVPPDNIEAASTENFKDFELILSDTITGLKQFDPFQNKFSDPFDGQGADPDKKRFTWKANWKIIIEKAEVFDEQGNQQETQDITLHEYLTQAFITENLNNDPNIDDIIKAVRDPMPLPISTSIVDERVQNASENSYEAAVQGAFEQFRSSPFFKRDPNVEYDRLLGEAFKEETTIYDSSGIVNDADSALNQEQQAHELRGLIFQRSIADFRAYVKTFQEFKMQGKTEEEAIAEIAPNSVAFQMGLIFKIDAPPGVTETDDSWIPDWLKETLLDDSKAPKLRQRSQPNQPTPTEASVSIRLFNPLKLQFKNNPLQFKEVKPFTDANTIAIAWDIDWTKPLPDNLTSAQKDPDQHLQYYLIRRIAIDDLTSSNREVNYAVKPCQVLYREAGGLLKALLPRFKVIDHFNQETLEDQANLPSTGLRYRYEITPVDIAGNASPQPLVVFVTRYPNEPPLVPTDAELIVNYQLEEQIFQDIPTVIAESVPKIINPQELHLEWTEPKPFKEGPNVPVGRYLLLFRPDYTLPIGSYGLDQQTQGDRQQLLPTSNARKLKNDIEIEIQRDEIQSVQLRSETGDLKQGFRVIIPHIKLEKYNILPRNQEWQPQSWRVFLQAEAFQSTEASQESPDFIRNPPRSALTPVRLILRVTRVTTPESSDLPIVEERRPASLEWLAKPLLFPMLPPEDLVDERGQATQTKEPDGDRLARFPMPQLLVDETEQTRFHGAKFKGSLTDIKYQIHPQKIRCLRLRWNQSPSEIANYPLNLHAGYEILELDIDAHTRKTFENPQELAQVLRKIQEVNLINPEDTQLTPNNTLSHNQWEAWYPSTLIRQKLERPKGSDLPLGAWYSWRESYLEWPQWTELEAQVKNQVGRPSLFHPCLQEIINILEANYIVDLQTSPPMQPNQFSDFLLATTASSDPYGWGVLQRLGLSVTFSLRLPLKGNLILGQDLLDAIKIALDTNFIITEKTLEKIRSLEIREKEKTLIKLSNLKDKLFTNQETFLAQLKDILVEQNLTDSDLEKIVNQAQRKQKDFYRYLHLELLFKPSYRIELEEKNPDDKALLGIVQLSLRPIPRQDLKYSQFKITGAAGTTINLLFTFQGNPLSPFTLINQSDNSSGQIDLEPSAEPIQRTITLPVNGETSLLLRAKVLPDVRIIIPLKNDIDSSKLPHFSDFFELSNKTLKVKQSLNALTKEFRAQFAEELNNTGNDANIAQLTFTFSQREFLATDFLSTYFTYSAENLQKRFTTGELSQQWQRFKKYLLSLNSSDVNEPKKITEADFSKVENISSFLSWSQRFFDYSPEVTTTDQTAQPWLVTAYPRSTSPAYAVPDSNGRINYDHLIADQWAHNYRYYILPQGRYDLLLKSLQQSLFRFSKESKDTKNDINESLPTNTTVKASLIDPEIGGLDIVLNRTHPVAKPLVLSSTRLDIQELDKTGVRAVILGSIWEVIIAQHPEQTLIERNQTLVRQLGFRQIAYALLRRFAYQQWIKQLKEFLPETPEKFQAPSNYATPPNLPGKINTLDHLDLNQLTTEQALSLDLYQRLGDFQQGALVLQWEALPFYYEHHLLLIAQSVSVVSDVNIIKQQDFEYRTPTPMGVTVTGIELQNWKAPEKPITFVQKIDGISLNSRSIKIPLRNFWDSLPEMAQIRWAIEKPANRGDNNSDKNKYASLPDPEVVYQIVERFSGNIEVQAEIFCDISSDKLDENGYKVRQLGQRFLVTVNQLNAPTHPQEDYLLNAGLIQITEQTLQETYNFNNLAEPTKFKVRLEKQSDSPTKLFVANVFSKEDRENILAVANNQASEAFEKDRDSLNSLYQSWFSEEPISSKIDLAQLPQALQSVFDFSSSNNCNLIWEGTITEEQKEALLLLDGDDDFRLALQRLSKNIPLQNTELSANLIRETCPQEILPKPIPEELKNNQKTEFQLISQPESINLVNQVWQLTWQLTWKGIMSDAQQSKLKEWAIIPEWQIAVSKLLAQLEQFFIIKTLPPELSPRPLNEDLPAILQGKLDIQPSQLIWLNVSLSEEEKEALNQLKKEDDQDFNNAIAALITAIEQAIANNSSPPIQVPLNPIIPRPNAGNLPNSLKENLTIEAEKIQWRGLILSSRQRDDLVALSGDIPFKEAIQDILNSTQTITVTLIWRRRLLNLLQNMSEKLLQIIISKQIDTAISPAEQNILKDFKENLPQKLLLDLPEEQSQQLEQLLTELDNQKHLEDGDQQIFHWLQEKLSPEEKNTLGEILQNHLLIGNFIMRYHGIMTIAEGEEILKHYPLPASRRAIQRLYETTFNRGLQGREIGIRTRRGSAKPSDLQLFEPTKLNF